MAAMFRKSEIAYNSIDFEGIGYITEEDLLNSKVIRTLNYPIEDVKLYFKYANLFNNSAASKKLVVPVNSISLDNFKKAFFP